VGTDGLDALVRGVATRIADAGAAARYDHPINDRPRPSRSYSRWEGKSGPSHCCG
jgi:hypothetical protein